MVNPNPYPSAHFQVLLFRISPSGNGKLALFLVLKFQAFFLPFRGELFGKQQQIDHGFNAALYVASRAGSNKFPLPSQ